MSYISMPSFRALFIQGKLRSAKKEQALFALTCIVFGQDKRRSAKKEQALFALTCIVFYDALQSIIGCVARYTQLTDFEMHVLGRTQSDGN